MENQLSDQDRAFLLSLARKTIQNAVSHQPLPTWKENDLSAELVRQGAAFVTLTINGELRGCIGSLEAHQSLVEDVRDHAYQAALEDYRFPPVSVGEVSKLHIEISRLTVPVPLSYEKPEDLPGLLRPGEDGVILKDGVSDAPHFFPSLSAGSNFRKTMRSSHTCALKWARRLIYGSVRCWKCPSTTWKNLKNKTKICVNMDRVKKRPPGSPGGLFSCIMI